MRKETFDIDILLISRNGDKKAEWTSLENKEAEPIEPAQMNIYQSNTYGKDLSWPQFEDEPRVQERQQVKDQQCSAYLFL